MNTFAIVSLGCAKNQVDAEWLIDLLERGGLLFSPNSLEADLVIINTCAFIESAREEAVDTILSYAAHCEDSPDTVKLAVAGCLVQGFEKDVVEGFPEVDFWIKGPSDRDAIKAILDHFDCDGSDFIKTASCHRSTLLSEAGSAFLKISEGCDNRCNYCSIPLIKGGLKSRTQQDLLFDASELAEKGVKEINLIAQDLTAWGSDLTGKGGGSKRGAGNLISLIEKLVELPFDFIRLLYTYPNGMSDELLDLMASEKKICSYLDIPFQHSHPNVLTAMGRKGSLKEYMSLIEKIRNKVDGVVLRTTLLTGHPGEGTREFNNLLKFVEEARFEWLGVFPYSPEEGTLSAKMKRPRYSTAVRRAGEVIDLYRECRDTSVFFEKETKPALVTAISNDILICRSETEAPDVDGVILVDGRSLKKPVNPGEVITVQLTGTDSFDFVAEAL